MKSKKMYLFILCLLIAGASLGCVNFVTRKLGGSETKTLPAGQKLVNITWKESDLWILTRPMRDDEFPETYAFSESSNLGILEGTVTIKEQSAKKSVEVAPTPFVNATIRP